MPLTKKLRTSTKKRSTKNLRTSTKKNIKRKSVKRKSVTALPVVLVLTVGCISPLKSESPSSAG